MKERINKIKLLVLDVDGVLTDGKIVIDDEGKEIKFFNVQDGFGLVLLKKAGFKTAIITARATKAVEVRARDLKFDRVYQDAYPKLRAYEELVRDFGISDEEVCYVGDDLPDLNVLKRVGFAVTVPNAIPEVKKVCHYITRKHGGEGAVREVVELILEHQGKWEGLLE